MSTKKKLLLGSAGAATAGGGGLDVDDVFSTYTYRGNGLSHVIGNGIALGNDGDGGSAEFTEPNTLIVPNDTSLQLGNGDFTIEAFLYPYEDRAFVISGFGYDTNNRFDFGWQSNQYPRAFIRESGTAYSTTNNSSYPISNYVGQWVHVAVTRNSNTVRLFVDGTQVGSFSFSGSMPSPGDGGVGIGSRWYHTRTSLTNSGTGHISNFRIVKGTALYTSNFTAPNSALTAVSGTSLLALQGDTPLSDNSGNSHGISQSIYNIYDEVTPSVFGPFTASESGSGGLVTIKSRTAANAMCWYDTERGANIRIRSHSTGGNSTRNDAVSSFNSNGFSLGSGGNENPDAVDQVAWTFRKAEKFFDVVQFTVGSTGTDTVINHSLGSDVGMVITKITSTTSNWGVHHRDLVSANEYMFLDTTGAAASFDTVSFSSTQVDLGTFWSTNYAGETGIAYIFSHHANDGSATGFGPDGDSPVISCGSYTGNGSTTGPTINLGFEPQWLFIRHTDASGNSSFILDNIRGISTGSADPTLSPNAAQDEQDTQNMVDLTSTGFQLKRANDNVNGNGNNYIYMAIRRGPLAAPTSSTDVFAIDDEQFTGGDAHAFYSGFTPDMVLEKQPSTTGSWPIATRLQGNKYLVTDGTSAETTGTSIIWDHMHGAFDPFSGTAYQAWMWKRAPGYFDVVAYTGTGSGSKTINHNLGVVPEMMWVKSRGEVKNWRVYHKDLDATAPEDKYLKLDRTDAVADSTGTWNDTAPTATQFTVGNSGDTNNAQPYIAYLFATVAGVSKVGSYTGTGSDQTIDCGFTNGARFVMIKRTSGIGSFVVYDTERGITASDDPYLFLDSNAAQNTNSLNDIDPHSSGFTLGGSGSYINASGQSYIFYAIA